MNTQAISQFDHQQLTDNPEKVMLSSEGKLRYARTKLIVFRSLRA